MHPCPGVVHPAGGSTNSLCLRGRARADAGSDKEDMLNQTAQELKAAREVRMFVPVSPAPPPPSFKH
jgi:hypothetical protein